eukprot:TRINITY_DN2270_c8_g1_i1.p1 TRINITY_DN2270_c8_g1~~TRINITY_DN2270_c8_g1_i1.p1  ORF type:complete len:446 (+),score=68.50 TRINITY_DN2270_c8_g1_i1:58-1338(+)
MCGHHKPKPATNTDRSKTKEKPRKSSEVTFTEVSCPEETKLIRERCSGTTMKRMWRIRNDKAEEAFNTTHKILSSQAGEYLDTDYGFHGTPDHNIYSIASHGFDITKRNRQAHGSGEYFAALPSSAVMFSSGSNYIFYCKLLIGQQSVHSRYINGQRFHVIITQPGTVMALPMYLLYHGSGWIASPAWLKELMNKTAVSKVLQDKADTHSCVSYVKMDLSEIRTWKAMNHNGAYFELLKRFENKKSRKLRVGCVDVRKCCCPRKVSRYIDALAVLRDEYPAYKVQDRQLFLNTRLSVAQLKNMLSNGHYPAGLSFSHYPKTIFSTDPDLRDRFVIVCSVATVDGELSRAVMPLYCISYGEKRTRVLKRKLEKKKKLDEDSKKEPSGLAVKPPVVSWSYEIPILLVVVFSYCYLVISVGLGRSLLVW